MTTKIVKDQPELSENDLRQFYQALVLSGADATDHHNHSLRLGAPSDVRELPEPQLDEEERASLLNSLQTRLVGSRAEAVREISTEQAVLGSNGDAGPQTQRNRSLMDWQQRKAVVMAQVEEILDVLATLPSSAGQQRSGQLLPLGIVSRREWNALFETSVSG